MKYFITILFLVCSIGTHAQQFDTCFVHFEINRATISPSYQDALMQVVAELKTAPDKKILIYGLADYLGNNTANQKLSEARAQAVHQFVKQHNIPASQILIVKGLGQDLAMGNQQEHGNQQKRNAMVLIRKNTPRNIQASPTQNTTSPKVVAPSIKELVENTAISKTFVLDNIHFQLHSVELAPQSRPVLLSLLKVLESQPQLKIRIEGHICCNKLEGFNPASAPYKLSVYRAKKIYQFFVDNRIAPERLSYVGFGRTKPIYEDETEKEHQDANRRVEIRIMAK